MKKIIIAFTLCAALNAGASNLNIPLRKAAPTRPSPDHPELSQIWNKCFAAVENIQFNNGTAVLSNLANNCSELNLNEIFFDQADDRFAYNLSRHANPFASLKKSKITLFARQWDIKKTRLDSRSLFVPYLSIDMRMNATQNGVPYDIFISQRVSQAGWIKISQTLDSQVTHTGFCRPNINCTYTVSTFKQVWKNNVSGEQTEIMAQEMQ